MLVRNPPPICTLILIAMQVRDTKQNKDKRHDEPGYSSILLHYSSIGGVSALVVCMYGQPGKVANSARGQLNRENEYFPVFPFVPENLVSRDRFGSPIPRQPAHLHTQAESGAYLWDSSRVPRRHPTGMRIEVTSETSSFIITKSRQPFFEVHPFEKRRCACALVGEYKQ